MTPQAVMALRQDLPEAIPFNYYPDRESAWLLQAHMRGDTPVRDLRQSTLAKLLDRPLIKPLTARGGGVLRFQDLKILSDAERVTDFDVLSGPAYEALETIFDHTWLDFEVTFDEWSDEDWKWAQMSRPGAHLVLQLGFPSDHAALLRRTLGYADRRKFECDSHPVRHDGRPTLAWVRLDIDLESRTALIEEVQSDWLRFVRVEVRRLQEQQPRSRELRVTQHYEMMLTKHYDKVWSKALLLAALVLLRDRLGMARIFMHQPKPGATLKWIDHTMPPVSLYSILPKAFCFRPTREVPEFLKPKRRKHLARLPKNRPLFWQMAF